MIPSASKDKKQLELPVRTIFGDKSRIVVSFVRTRGNWEKTRGGFQQEYKGLHLGDDYNGYVYFMKIH